MRKHLLYFGFISLIICLLAPEDSEARRKKRRVFKRKWSISATTGYNIPSLRLKQDAPINRFNLWEAVDKGANQSYTYPEGQMYPFFSSLELSRNFGRYELGARLQFTGPVFASPFIKWNFIKNNSRAKVVPSLTVGLSPSYLMGVWMRLNIGFSINRYAAAAPFVGCYGYYNLSSSNLPSYGKSNAYCHTGLSLSLYY